MKREDFLHLQRTVRFGDTDAAGVIHFHHLLRWCHEAWEESLENYGLQAVEIFPSSKDLAVDLSIALPIVHCEADFFSPIRISEKLAIELCPVRLDISSFEVQYKFQSDRSNVAVALIRHRSINPDTRSLCELPNKIHLWLESAAVNHGISSL
nr:acyl-CoA thioesterase [Prochlorococcus marinus]